MNLKIIADNELSKVVSGSKIGNIDDLRSPYCHICGQRKVPVVIFMASNTTGVMCPRCRDIIADAYVRQAQLEAYRRAGIDYIHSTPTLPSEVETDSSSQLSPQLLPSYYYGR